MPSAAIHAFVNMPRVLELLYEVSSMADVVNLKRFKKRVAREQSARQAETNRARFGRTKFEHAADERRTNRANDLLNQHRIDGEDAS
jgi:Domain of unknown function (DUF4169)